MECLLQWIKRITITKNISIGVEYRFYPSNPCQQKDVEN